MSAYMRRQGECVLAVNLSIWERLRSLSFDDSTALRILGARSALENNPNLNEFVSVQAVQAIFLDSKGRPLLSVGRRINARISSSTRRTVGKPSCPPHYRSSRACAAFACVPLTRDTSFLAVKL